MRSFTVKEAQTLKSFTDNYYAQGSFFFAQLLKKKDIKVNGLRVNKDMPVKVGDVVCYYTTQKQEEKKSFDILYEDENLLVADKESGVNSEAVFHALEREQACYFIHRLDRNTQGLLLFAKNPETEKVLLSAFKENRVEKEYHALCFGKLEKNTDILTAYLKKDAENARVKIYNGAVAGSEKIITEYRVLEEQGDKTKLKIILHTGKTHQIRAHLAFIGCPIVGDMKYGNVAKNKECGLSRQCLIAKTLRLSLLIPYAYLNEKVFTSRFDF